MEAPNAKLTSTFNRKIRDFISSCHANLLVMDVRLMYEYHNGKY